MYRTVVNAFGPPPAHALNPFSLRKRWAIRSAAACSFGVLRSAWMRESLEVSTKPGQLHVAYTARLDGPTESRASNRSA